MPRKFAYTPSLVVVDGGAPQVAAAERALADLGVVDVALCGLAKRLEEVWLPGEEFPLILPRTSEGLYLLQRVRDEAHRFAITHHRSRRSASMVESLLDDVPGLGEIRRKALLKYFGSLRKLRAATVEQIAEVPGHRSADRPRGQGSARRAGGAGVDQPDHRRGARGLSRRRANNGAMSDAPGPVRLLVITGMSGAGRRTAGHTLEDLGWFVVDNLPPSLLPELIETSRQRQFSRVAVVLDVRTRSEFEQIPAAFAELGRAGVVPQILFLDASDEAIVRRQESVRRPLPLQGSGGLLDGIQKEREMLAGIRASADLVIDTTSVNVHELAARVTQALGGGRRRSASSSP